MTILKKEKKTIFSGMQASGIPTLGNYLGALKNWIKLQKNYNCIFCCVNMHSLTVRINPETLKNDSINLIMFYIASGIDPENSIIYCQSQVSQHAELAWILNCYTYVGELNRMTQFKEKSNKYSNNINAGLFTYPILMAADILLYETDLVPVGNDQKQHLELARNISIRFNSVYGNIFKIPEPYINNIGSRIMGLKDPTKKMSKSENNNDDTIFLTDNPDIIMNKVKRSVTDSYREIKFDPINKPGISNLLSIYSVIKNKSIKESENIFNGKTYKYFKEIVAECIIEEIKPIQKKLKELSKNRDYIDEVLKKNSERASFLADKTLDNVYSSLGLFR